jgi:hypothetical protein
LFTAGFIKALSNFTKNGGNVFMSGAYIGTDMNENRDSAAIHFASDILHFTWRTNHATKVGLVKSTDQGVSVFPGELSFNTTFNPEIYRVESPDAIEPYGDNAFRICRYASGSTSAGIAYIGSYKAVILGFPFETITGDDAKAELMKKVLHFFTLQKDL